MTIRRLKRYTSGRLRSLPLALQIKNNFKNLASLNATQVLIKEETGLNDNNIQMEDKGEFDKNDESNLDSNIDIRLLSDKLTLALPDSGFCKHCRKSFENEDEHQKFVNDFEKKRYYCRNHPSCSGKFTRHELIQHCIDSGIHIPDVSKFFRKARSKTPRIQNLEGEPCEICFEMFPIKNVLEDHYNIHEDQYLCEVCNRGFKKIMDYVCHMQEHSGHRMYECPVCTERKEKVYQMRLHLIRTHDQFKPYKCNVCEKRFSFYAIYREHAKYFHTGEKRFVCDQCGKRFMYSWYLNSHKQLDHNEPKEPTKCPLCPVKLSSKRYLQRHLRAQHRQAPCVCDVCGKDFKSKQNLNIHLKMHKGDKRHKCSYCDKMFLKSGARKEHERVHTGDKPYKCTFCTKGFTQRNSLVIHFRSHTGERPYVCQICSRGFVSKTALVNHLKSCKGRVDLD
ncbi:zinc finger protein OZF-like [Agrilus planipennis]|uniref:Zinc finger protein OZF-like n=1 Tax=Agrilus planipennis TaxID=224129 RepID=A0A1W4XH76_AGRPL|nr:zinc finger protein OZF-like [Agrilus planipennis]